MIETNLSQQKNLFTGIGRRERSQKIIETYHHRIHHYVTTTNHYCEPVIYGYTWLYHVIPCYTIQIFRVPAAFQTKSRSFCTDHQGPSFLGSTYSSPQKDNDQKQQTNPSTLICAQKKRHRPPVTSALALNPAALQNEWAPNIRAISTPRKMQKSKIMQK